MWREIIIISSDRWNKKSEFVTRIKNLIHFFGPSPSSNCFWQKYTTQYLWVRDWSFDRRTLLKNRRVFGSLPIIQYDEMTREPTDGRANERKKKMEKTSKIRFFVFFIHIESVMTWTAARFFVSTLLRIWPGRFVKMNYGSICITFTHVRTNQCMASTTTTNHDLRFSSANNPRERRNSILL